MMSPELAQRLLDLHHIEYLVCDEHQRVLAHSANLPHWLRVPPHALLGQPVTLWLDALHGLEEDFAALRQGERASLVLEKMALPGPPTRYVNLTVAPLAEGWLVAVSDITPFAELEQRVTQQRNEVTLLSHQLAAARAQLDDLLHRFLPEQVADHVLANPQHARLGGTRRSMSVLFADLRGFTHWTEGQDPENVLHWLNKRLAVAVEAIVREGGTLDKFMGDAVLGVFNAPHDDPLHALHAVRAAWHIAQAMRDETALQFGFGIHTGEAVAGNIGTDTVMNYTVIGDAVNQAKRIQELAEGGQLLISEATYAKVAGHVHARWLTTLALRGRAEETAVYEVLGVRAGL